MRRSQAIVLTKLAGPFNCGHWGNVKVARNLQRIVDAENGRLFVARVCDHIPTPTQYCKLSLMLSDPDSRARSPGAVNDDALVVHPTQPFNISLRHEERRDRNLDVWLKCIAKLHHVLSSNPGDSPHTRTHSMWLKSASLYPHPFATSMVQKETLKPALEVHVQCKSCNTIPEVISSPDQRSC